MQTMGRRIFTIRSMVPRSAATNTCYQHGHVAKGVDNYVYTRIYVPARHPVLPRQLVRHVSIIELSTRQHALGEPQRSSVD